LNYGLVTSGLDYASGTSRLRHHATSCSRCSAPASLVALSNTDGVANSCLFICAAGSDTDSPLLKTMHALFLHVGISEKVSYDLCTLAWLIVVVWHKALCTYPPHLASLRPLQVARKEDSKLKYPTKSTSPRDARAYQAGARYRASLFVRCAAHYPTAPRCQWRTRPSLTHFRNK